MDIIKPYVDRNMGRKAEASAYTKYLKEQSPIDIDAGYIVKNNVQNVPKTEELQEDELIDVDSERGQVWAAASKVIYDSMYDGVNSITVKAPENEQDFGRFGVEFYGQLEHNFSQMGYNIAKLQGADERTKMALYHLQSEYGKLPMFSWNGAKRFAKGLSTDPTTYASVGTLGLGFLGRAGVKQTTKQGFKEMLRQGITNPYAIAAIEGGGYTGLYDYFTQEIAVEAGMQDEIDAGQVALSTGIGAAAGPAVVAAGEGIVKGAQKAAPAIRDLFDEAGQAADARIAERDADTGTTLTAGADPMPAVDAAISAAGRAARRDPNDSAGDAMAQAQARYFETGNYEPPTAENPVSIVPPKPDEPGIIAFHGSGADFDEFRLEMIGTGEGAQAYGYGLYFTDSEDIAKFYRDTISNETAKIPYGSTEDAAQAVPDNVPFLDVDGFRSYLMGDAEEVLDSVLTKQYAGENPGQEIIDFNLQILRKAGVLNVKMPDGTTTSLLMNQSGDQFTLTPVKKQTGKMYKVGLAPKPDELLDYDLPLSQQPKMLELIDDVHGDPEIIIQQAGLDPATATGGDFVNALGGIGQEQGAKAASEFLAKAGIPGIRYATNDTRSKQFNLKLDVRGKPYRDTEPIYARSLDDAKRIEAEYKEKGFGVQIEDIRKSNYVIFDDKAIKILEKYGIVGPVAVTAAGVKSAQDDDEKVANASEM